MRKYIFIFRVHGIMIVNLTSRQIYKNILKTIARFQLITIMMNEKIMTFCFYVKTFFAYICLRENTVCYILFEPLLPAG